MTNCDKCYEFNLYGKDACLKCPDCSPCYYCTNYDMVTDTCLTGENCEGRETEKDGQIS